MTAVVLQRRVPVSTDVRERRCRWRRVALPSGVVGVQVESVVAVESDGDPVQGRLDDGSVLVTFELHLANFGALDVAEDSRALPAVAGHRSVRRGDRDRRPRSAVTRLRPTGRTLRS